MDLIVGSVSEVDCLLFTLARGWCARLTGAKIEALLKIVAEAQRGGEKVLIFSLFKRYLVAALLSPSSGYVSHRH